MSFEPQQDFCGPDCPFSGGCILGRGGGWKIGGRRSLWESTATSSCSLHQELPWHQWKWSRSSGRGRDCCHLHAGLHEPGPLPNTGITEPPFHLPHSLLPQSSLIELRELEARPSHQRREAVVEGRGWGRKIRRSHPPRWSSRLCVSPGLRSDRGAARPVLLFLSADGCNFLQSSSSSPSAAAARSLSCLLPSLCLPLGGWIKSPAYPGCLCTALLLFHSMALLFPCQSVCFSHILGIFYLSFLSCYFCVAAAPRLFLCDPIWLFTPFCYRHLYCSDLPLLFLSH